MRLKINLETSKKLTLPVHYNAILQGLIYAQIDAHLAEWLHDQAYQTEKRLYKMFTFSRLVGPFRRENGQLCFQGSVGFQLASLNSEVLCSLAEHLLKSPDIRLGANQCRIAGIEVLAQPEVDFSKPVRVKTLAPLVIYETLKDGAGRNKTHYLNPQDLEWGQRVIDNLARKAKSLDWEDPKAALKDAWIRPQRVDLKDQKIVMYKKPGQRDFVIKGWTGLYKIKLPERYFWLAYDAGLGGKNAQGFGMVEVVK